MAEDAMVQAAQLLLAEQPKVDVAVKNLLAVKLAKRQVLHVEAKVHVLGEDGVEVREEMEDLDATTIQRMAGAILRAVNGLAVPDPGAWAQATPQGEEQTGVDRMDQIMRYKVLHMTWNRAKSEQNKPTKVFGRSALRLVWPAVRKEVLQGAAGLASEKLLNQLMDDLCVEEPAGGASTDADLVWALDFEAALAERSQKRAAAAAQASAPTAAPPPAGPSTEPMP